MSNQDLVSQYDATVNNNLREENKLLKKFLKEAIKGLPSGALRITDQLLKADDNDEEVKIFRLEHYNTLILTVVKK